MAAHMSGDTITFLLTDIEGSTRLWEEHADSMRLALARHDGLLRSTIEQCGGLVFKTMGDSFYAAFSSVNGALEAAILGQQRLQVLEPLDLESRLELKVRMAVHSGDAEIRDGDYFGPSLNRASRLLGVGHGGQILLSAAACALLKDPLPSGMQLRHLGEHILKDLRRSESIYQLLHPQLRDEFPPLRSLDNPQFANNLPQQLTSFLGRDAELKEVAELLTKKRLLTFTGPGGTGKTRLAIQAAADRFEEYPHGVWLVELAALSDPSLLAQTAAAALGIREEPGRPFAELLPDFLREKRLLLVLDNCEHLIEAAAALVSTILQRCAAVRVLATSREPLRVAGEFVYPVPSLALPDPARADVGQGAGDFGAVQLFRERAESVTGGFALTPANAEAVVHICRRLDGIPLAIELAAARVRSLSVEQIARRLDDRFSLLTQGSRAALPRQQTLRALIDWSWDLLGPAERAMLRRLSVFAGSFILEASEEVCSGPESVSGTPAISSSEVLDLVTQLVEKSLVIVDERGGGFRYRLLETVRGYAAERLLESGEQDEYRRRHFLWCLSFAQEAEKRLEGPEMRDWLDRVELDLDNLRAALSFSRGVERLRLAEAVNHFWRVRGYLTEGREWLESALREAGDADPLLRASGLNRAGILAWRQGDFASARRFIAECLTLRERAGDLSGVAGALNNLGLVSDDEGDLASGRLYYEKALRAYRELGDRVRVGMVLANLGANLIDQNEIEAAEAAFQEFLVVAEESQDPWCIGTAWQNLAETALRRCEYERAAFLSRKAIMRQMELGDKQHVVTILISMGQIQLNQDLPERAIELITAAQSIAKQEGIYLREQDIGPGEEARARARTLVSTEEYNSCARRGGAWSLEEAVAKALEIPASEH